MADTFAQREVADWIRGQALPERLGEAFETREVRLRCGGTYRFPLVGDRTSTIGTICTASASTTSGKNAVGKMNKVRADLYFLLLVEAAIRLVVVTELDMYAKLLKERDQLRRIPSEITFHLVELPAELRERLQAAQRTASLEVTPS